MVSNQALSQAVTPRRSRFWPTVLLVASVVFMIVMAVVGFLQLAGTERVIILVRPVAYGQPISAEDLATVEVSRHRPQQLAGVGDPGLAIGKYAARALAPDDLLQPSMLLETAPSRPVYPSGEELGAEMVAVPFSTETTGPITNTDVLNIGFFDESGDAQRCVDPSEQAPRPVAAPSEQQPAVEDEIVSGVAQDAPAQAGQPYACRLLVNVNVLHVDGEKATAYLELTPYQAQAMRAVQAAALPLYAERSTSGLAELEPLTRLDPSQLAREALSMPAQATSEPVSPDWPGHATGGGALAMLDPRGAAISEQRTPSDEQAHLLDELHVLASTGRLDWTLPADGVLEHALGRCLGWRDWAELPWYGALDALLRDPGVSDVLVNAPGHECRVVRDGNWHATGVRPHASWWRSRNTNCCCARG